MELSKEEKSFLLKSARDTIHSLFTELQVEQPDYEKHPIMKSLCGAFVTLTIGGRLRGCIGYIISDKTLFDTLRDAAIQAATSDPRFPTLTKDEFPLIHIEISILSEPFPMNSYDDIEVGKHGLIVEEKGRRGLLLPQVPVEHGMNKEQYLSALCEKAGLPSFYWKEKTLNISMFTATVFSEEEIGG